MNEITKETKKENQEIRIWIKIVILLFLIILLIIQCSRTGLGYSEIILAILLIPILIIILGIVAILSAVGKSTATNTKEQEKKLDVKINKRKTHSEGDKENRDKRNTWERSHCEWCGAEIWGETMRIEFPVGSRNQVCKRCWYRYTYGS